MPSSRRNARVAKQRGSLSRQRNQVVEAVANDGFSCQSERVVCHEGMVSRDEQTTACWVLQHVVNVVCPPVSCSRQPRTLPIRTTGGVMEGKTRGVAGGDVVAGGESAG